MDLVATMALDRDAINTVTLRLLPPSAAPGAAVSPWLLWHTIPITASLSRTLSRLVSVEASAMAQALQETSSSLEAATSAPHPEEFGSLTTTTTTLMPSIEAAAVPSADAADTATRSSSVASKSSSSSSTQSAVSAPTTRTRAAADGTRASWLELVRVGYVVSEIHAYCVLFRCRHAAQAARMKAALEEGAALGLTAPVEYVSDARPVVVTHRTFAGSQGEAGAGAEAVGTHDPSSIDHDPHADHHLPRAGARWSTGAHTASLLEAIATVYPVRDNGDSVGGTGDGDGSSESDDGHHNAAQPLQRHHQYRHLHGSPHTVGSAPTTPSPARLPPAASGAMRKGAAPPRSRHASVITAAVVTPTSSRTALSPAAAAAQASAARASPSRPAHTPPRTPLTAWSGGGVGGVGLGPLLSGDFCAICLDSLHLSACVTTLCQHSFHLSCYAQLPSGSAECPLCRFSVYELLNDARCKVCGTYEDLWVCLICGHVACGRARRDHQQAHYRVSGHSCSWQSTTNRIRNLSSRMFLHQEVALLLDEDGLDDAAPAYVTESRSPPTTRALSADAGTGDARTPAEEMSARTTAMAEKRPPPDMDRAWSMSWSDSAMEDDLQEARQESKEVAVAQYYTTFLRQLAEEQQRWYEATLAARRRRRRERQMVAGASASRHGAEKASFAPGARITLNYVALNERRQRRRVLSQYVQATITLLQAARREYTGMAHKLRAARNDAQQQVLLRSHFNAGLVAQAEQVRQRTQDLQRKGAKASQEKAAEETQLQSLVEKALASL
ncbi:hypothetical protein LSCM1_08182 [Leishmania martiniquensis]|uniref:Uncharacterized protein n=1 Tax=Leishmania martiniquensis TaxID=1580590 RepID=A0A836HKW7_9TRYP|nr:hypothetical protein LSCM1_08182 [Leishmania martiniquensis]